MGLRMLGRFYDVYHRRLVLAVLLTMPLLTVLSLGVRSNNDLETWMPQTSPARLRYEEFKRTFGVEEFLFIGFDLSHQEAPDAQLVESLCGRLERLPGIRRGMSPDRMRAIMRDHDVPDAEIEQRLRGLFTNDDGRLIGVAACLSDYGLKHRTPTVRAVQEVLKYCQLDGTQTMLTGAPLFVSELDRLGSREANVVYFTMTLGICFGLLFYMIRELKLALLVFGLTVWTINATTVLLSVFGGEMNFVLSSIPVLTMVLTMAISVHYLYYYQEAVAEGAAHPTARAVQLAWWPTCIATLTTCLGEIALSVSDIVPIRQFAYAASFSSLMAMFSGLGITPAILMFCPTLPRRSESDNRRDQSFVDWIMGRSRKIAIATVLMTVACSGGVLFLKSDMKVVDFLPEKSKVRQDFLRVTRDLARVDCLEAVVDCGADERPFSDKLDQVRRIEGLIRQHPAVDQTLSLTKFFPNELPQSPLERGALLKRAAQKQTQNEYSAHGLQLWRISIRIRNDKQFSRQKTLDELTTQLAHEPVTITGMAALVESTQAAIFDSFWQSVLVALALITLAMMVFLKSVWRGVLAMIPNVAPLIWVYGLLGWLGWPVDIAMMLSGSIALGMSVDGTFHFMSRFRHQHNLALESDDDNPAATAARHALMESSIPFIQATLTATVGMLGLTLSSFAPTARFGWLMIALMLAALVGDVLMLPALMYLTHRRQRREHATLRMPQILDESDVDTEWRSEKSVA